MTLIKNFSLIISIIILYLSIEGATATWHGLALIIVGALNIYLERERFYTTSNYQPKLKKVIQLSGRIFGLLLIIIGVFIFL